MKIKSIILIICFIACNSHFVFAQNALVEDSQKDIVAQQSDSTKDILNLKKNLAGSNTKEDVQEEFQRHPRMEEGPPFFVKMIVIKGNMAFSEEMLTLFASNYEGRKITFKELQNFTDEVTEFYRLHGYTTSWAYIPPQTIRDGVVVINVVEGRIGSIKIEGNKWFYDRLYRRDLSFKEGDFLQMAAVEASIQRINAENDRSVKVYLQAGKEVGTTDVEIKTQENFPVHASYEYNLQGTSLTGQARDVFHLTDNNLTGHGDTLSSVFTFANAGAVDGGFIHYEFPDQINDRVYHVDVGGENTHLLKQLESSNVRGQSLTYIPGVTQTFVRTDTAKIDGDIRFEIKDSKTTVQGAKYSFDRMRVLAGGPRITMDDSYGRTMMGADLHVGIPNFLGASSLHDSLASRVDSGGEFVYLSASAARIQNLVDGISLIEKVAGQYSPSPLTSMEQFYLGGMYSVRGYPENDSSGDSGFSFSTELRVPMYLIPEAWTVPGYKGKTWRNVISLIGFIDGGRDFNNKRQNAASSKDSTLLGAGYGLRIYVTPDMDIDFDIAYPLGARPSDGKHEHTDLSVRVGF